MIQLCMNHDTLTCKTEGSSAKNQRPNLNALSTHRTLGRPRVRKGSVRNTAPLPNILIAVKALEQQPILIRHARPVVPLLARVIRNSSCLPITVWIPVLNWYQIAISYGLAVGDCERSVQDRAFVYRTPYVDDAVAPLQKLLSFVW